MTLVALLGGAGISLAAHELLLLTGDIFGVSGFIHRSFKGSSEALAGVAGLVSAGALVAIMENNVVTHAPALTSPPAWLLLSGFLVGVGTKLAKGCTSGHMICGISRLSPRSTVATMTFFATAAMTANVFHRDTLGVISLSSRALASRADATIFLLQAIPVATIAALYKLIPKFNLPRQSIRALRHLTYFITAFQFGLSLRLSDLTKSTRVIGFLLPFRRGFDPSLIFVAASSIPLGILLYYFVRAMGINATSDEIKHRPSGPIMGGQFPWKTRASGIDKQLIVGSAIFGFGWGLTGICPGTAVVNIGRSLGNGDLFSPFSLWMAAMAVGGFFAEQMESRL